MVEYHAEHASLHASLVGRSMTAQDQGVMMTSNDALLTKVYAESKGYFKDEFVSCFLPKPRQKKMLPIINRGTWARVYAIRQIILRFMAAYSGNKKVNVLSLGAGYDSTFFWLRKTLGLDNTTSEQLHWVEVDFAEVVRKKEEVIRAHAKLADMIGPFDFAGGHIITPGYKLFSGDVRDGGILTSRFSEHGVDRSLPTLLITECLMIYMTGEDSTSVYNWISDFFSGDLVSVNYEMINPDDPFGRMMVQNLEERGCQLLGITDCPSVEAQIKRMNIILADRTQAEKSRLKIECLAMPAIYSTRLNREGERTRVEKLEMFDEFEEWELLQSHYCICLGIRMNSDQNPHPLQDLSI